MNQALEKAIEHWTYVAPILSRPKNEKEFKLLQMHLNTLLDKIAGDENHPLMGLIDMISDLIASYEEENHPLAIGRGVDALKYLMISHHLHQDDFPEIGSQGVVSEILHEKRSLNLRQIKLLAKRFSIEPATFIDE